MPRLAGFKIPLCTNCGACCVGGERWVEVTRKDRKRLGDSDLVRDGDIEPFAMKTDRFGACVALDGRVARGGRIGNCRCSVYERRPAICRKVKRGSALCLYMLGWHRILSSNYPPFKG
jgi:Fe-S-cluster containining protein